MSPFSGKLFDQALPSLHLHKHSFFGQFGKLLICAYSVCEKTLAHANISVHKDWYLFGPVSQFGIFGLQGKEWDFGFEFGITGFTWCQCGITAQLKIGIVGLHLI